MKQSRFNKQRGALSRRNVLNAFLQALQPDWLSNMILSKVRRNKSIPRSLLLYARHFSLSGCARQVAYTSYRFLSVHRFQGEHRCHSRAPQCNAKNAAVQTERAVSWSPLPPPCIYESMPGRPSWWNADKGIAHQRGKKAQRCNWNPLGLRNVRWPSSSKQALKEPTPCPLPYLFNPESSAWLEKTEWVGSEQMWKSQGFAQPPKQS